MKIVHDIIEVETGFKISFDDVTDRVQAILKKSDVQDGIVTVFSQHTSCTVFIQEDSEDVTYQNIPLILQDTINVLEKIIPTCQHEGQYLHPGPVHTQRAMELRDEKSEWMLNTDGHIRSVILGRSETIPVVNGEMTLGEFGRIYFSDMDQTRARSRKVRVQILGQ